MSAFNVAGRMNPGWLALGLAAAGAVAALVFAPLARAAENEPPSHRSWQLWAKEPGEPEWRVRGRPLGRTACLLDLASLTNVLPTGSRVACVHIEEIKPRKDFTINNGER